MSSTRLRWSACLFGFGLGGFFDGILLHQILQWHHLLSSVRSDGLATLQGQVVADGVFHGLMYLVALVGLGLLLRARAELAQPAAGQRFVADFLVGFGAWHVVDALLSHWLTGIHRIRMDAANPLFWDVLWLVLFGLVPIAIAMLMRRRTGSGGDAARLSAALPLVLVASTVAAGVVAAMPAGASGDTTTVVLRPGANPARLLEAIAETDTRLLWSDASGAVWVIRPDRQLSRFGLYRAGAMYVSGSLLPAGCSAWLGVSGAGGPATPATPAGPAGGTL
jgi:uncharacterized membrane protein